MILDILGDKDFGDVWFILIENEISNC